MAGPTSSPMGSFCGSAAAQIRAQTSRRRPRWSTYRPHCSRRESPVDECPTTPSTPHFHSLRRPRRAWDGHCPACSSTCPRTPLRISSDVRGQRRTFSPSLSRSANLEPGHPSSHPTSHLTQQRLRCRSRRAALEPVLASARRLTRAEARLRMAEAHHDAILLARASSHAGVCRVRAASLRFFCGSTTAPPVKGRQLDSPFSQCFQ